MPRKHPLNVTLAGMPELNFFESDEKREAALVQIASDSGRWGWKLGVAIVACGMAGIGAMLFAEWLLHFVAWPDLFERGIRVAAAVLATLVLIRRFHRRGYPALLRRKLIEQGVPMCLKCGYNLRGQPWDSPRCPECGTAINEASRKILGHAQPP